MCRGSERSNTGSETVRFGDEDCKKWQGRAGWGTVRKWDSSGEWFGVRGGGVQCQAIMKWCESACS